jgi:hypothetical protein
MLKVFQYFDKYCFKDIHPEDGNRSVCRNVGKLATFDEACPRNPS